MIKKNRHRAERKKRESVTSQSTGNANGRIDGLVN